MPRAYGAQQVAIRGHSARNRPSRRVVAALGQIGAFGDVLPPTLLPLLLLKLLHLLCWVYWLGADVGTFYAARFVANGRLTAAQRATAAQIMLGIDLAPRVCMPLTLATGVHLAVLAAGWGLATVTLVAIWAVCLAWLAVALWLHHKLRSARALVVARADFIWRGLLAAALTITAAAGLLGSWPALAPWLAFKLLCFALCVVCGLAIVSSGVN